MVKWRQRVGADNLEKLLAETIRLAMKHKQVTPQQLSKITVDTTVQEKAIDPRSRIRRITGPLRTETPSALVGPASMRL